MIKFWKVVGLPDTSLMLGQKRWEMTARWGNLSLHAVLTGPRLENDSEPTHEAAYESLLRHLIPLCRE